MLNVANNILLTVDSALSVNRMMIFSICENKEQTN
jgi:hypothetical protein